MQEMINACPMLEGKNLLEDLDVDGRITLKWMFTNRTEYEGIH
jgi:hypothetical protein